MPLKDCQAFHVKIKIRKTAKLQIKIIANKMLTTEEFSSDINKDKAYLINEVSEVDEQAKRWVLYPCYEEETLFLEAHEAVNEVGSVLTYESPLVDPQIGRIEDIVSKCRRE